MADDCIVLSSDDSDAEDGGKRKWVANGHKKQDDEDVVVCSTTIRNKPPRGMKRKIHTNVPHLPVASPQILPRSRIGPPKPIRIPPRPAPRIIPGTSQYVPPPRFPRNPALHGRRMRAPYRAPFPPPNRMRSAIPNSLVTGPAPSADFIRAAVLNVTRMLKLPSDNVITIDESPKKKVRFTEPDVDIVVVDSPIKLPEYDDPSEMNAEVTLEEEEEGVAVPKQAEADQEFVTLENDDLPEVVKMEEETISTEDIDDTASTGPAMVQFISFCMQRATSKTDRTILEKLLRKWKKTKLSEEPHPEFDCYIMRIQRAVNKDPENMFVHTRKLFEKMNTVEASLLKEEFKQATKAASEKQSEEDVKQPEGDAVKSESPEDVEKAKSTSRHVRRLEKALKLLERKIRQLEEADNSLDEMSGNGSSYLLLDRYKRKAVAIYKKLCQLDGAKESTGRLVEKKLVYNASRFDTINRRVEDLVNQSLEFPEYCDILDVVTKVNREDGLLLRPVQLEDIARKIFQDIGKELKRRRVLDHADLFGCHLTDNAQPEQDDPAIGDTDLEEKLQKSAEEGERKIENLIDSFVQKQIEGEEEGEGKKKEEEEESSSSEEEEEEEEINLEEFDQDGDADEDETCPDSEPVEEMNDECVEPESESSSEVASPEENQEIFPSTPPHIETEYDEQPTRTAEDQSHVDQYTELTAQPLKLTDTSTAVETLDDQNDDSDVPQELQELEHVKSKAALEPEPQESPDAQNEALENVQAALEKLHSDEKSHEESVEDELAMFQSDEEGPNKSVEEALERLFNLECSEDS